MKRILLLIISFSVLVFGISSPAQAAPKSIKLTKSQFKYVGPYQCGLVKGAWVPGLNTKSTKKVRYFIPFTAYAADEAKKAKKVKGKSKSAVKKRAAFEKKAANFTARANQQASTCASGVYVTAMPTCPTCIPMNTDPLRINISGAKSLAKATGGISSLRGFTGGVPEGGNDLDLRLANSESTLAAVSETGALRNAITSGSIDIQNFVVASNGKAYLTSWNAYIDGNRSGASCILIEVSSASDVPSCIQYNNYSSGDMFSMSWFGNYSNNYNPSIQVDGAGAVYYSGYKGSSAVLRKFENGVTRDIISDNVQINDFLVVPNGDVVVSGYTQSLGTSWLRLYAANGSVRPIESSSNAAFMRKFSDGNVYFGINNEIKIFDTTSLSKRGTAYFGGSGSSNDSAVVCPSNSCGSISSPKKIVQLSDSSVYSLSSSNTSNVSIAAKVYPAVSEINRGQVIDAKIIGSAGNRLAVAGLDVSSAQTLEIYNPANSTYTTVLGANDEIEIAALSYRSSSNSLVFSGLRFRDNKTVVGSVDLNTNSVSIDVATSSKLYDLQAFG